MSEGPFGKYQGRPVVKSTLGYSKPTVMPDSYEVGQRLVMLVEVDTRDGDNFTLHHQGTCVRALRLEGDQALTAQAQLDEQAPIDEDYAGE